MTRSWKHIRKRRPPPSRADLLDGLRRLHARDGFVSRRTIASERGLPSPDRFIQTFGGLQAAYAEAGLPCEMRELAAAGRERYLAMMRQDRLPTGPKTGQLPPS
jgi:hypothetical protein